MYLFIKVLLATALVLGLVKGLSLILARYGPVGISARRDRRVRLLEATSLPGGVILYVVQYNGEEVLIAASKAGLTQITAGRPAAPARERAIDA